MFKKLNKSSIEFLRICTKNAIRGNFEKILENFLKKIAKNALF